MNKIFNLIIIFYLCMETQSASKRLLYFDNDSNIDDMIAYLVIANEPTIELIGVSFVPADCELEIGKEVMTKLLTLTHKTHLKVAYTSYQGKNPFPSFAKDYALRGLCLPKLLNIKRDDNLLVNDIRAHEHLANTILHTNKDVKVDILITGPPTNVVNAIEKFPQLRSKIGTIVWMGGAVDVEGNNDNKTSEWNCYWDPISSKKFLTSGLDIVIFPLDATNQVLVTRDNLAKLAEQSNYDASNLVSQLFATTYSEGDYYMWDILAASYFVCDNHVQYRKVELDVIVGGEEDGKIIKKKGSGAFVRVADKVNVEMFYEYFLKALRYNFE